MRFKICCSRILVIVKNVVVNLFNVSNYLLNVLLFASFCGIIIAMNKLSELCILV